MKLNKRYASSPFKKNIIAMSLLSLTGFASAGTMGAVKVPHPWQGVYIGLNGGGIWAESPFTWTDFGATFFPGLDTAIAAAANATLNSSGFIGGGQIGANAQYGNYLLGVELDIDYTDLDANRYASLNGVSNAITEHVSTDWLSTIRLRMGYAQNSWLLYGTAGLALTQVQFSDQVCLPSGSCNSQSQGKNQSGWTAGAGAEWKFAANWSAKAEYLYVDFGSSAYTSVLVPSMTNPTIRHHHDLTANIARLGVNYTWG